MSDDQQQPSNQTPPKATEPDEASATVANLDASSSKPKSVVVDKVPDDKVCVRLLLISGLKTDLLFTQSDSIEAVKIRIFNAWPSDWTGEQPETVANLRVLLRGKFLEPSSTLADAKFPVGQTTTCHLLVKNGAPVAEAASPAGNAKTPTGGGGGGGGGVAGNGGAAAVQREPGSGCSCTIL
ncbi:UNVERIFIED_CONTAM: hypothetical protein HDU68_005933 [Siphonaria sp. JEL0065]|nr:hypothetical protein HDU68_005933 [Siphonaria sp. JEL0065]